MHSFPSIIFDADISSLLNKKPSALQGVPGIWGWDGQWD